MKHIRRILLALYICLFGLYLFSNTYNDNIYNNISNAINDMIADANNKDLDKVNGLGDLVDDKDIKDLEDSNVSGYGVSIDTRYYPYYGMLSNNEKAIYKQFYANVKNLKTTFVPVVDIDKNGINRSFVALFYDHPEFFWLDTSYSYKYTKTGRCVQIIIKFNDTINDIGISKSKFEAASNEIISGANRYNSNYDKEKYVHDALIKNTSYNVNSHLNQSAYSVLVEKTSVCAGYAKAFQYIMNRLGIPTYYVVGRANGDHAWNIILLDDGYYNVDVTWDDQGSIIYDYFNRSDKEFADSHFRRDLSLSLPSCNSFKYSGNIYNNISKVVNDRKEVVTNNKVVKEEKIVVEKKEIVEEEINNEVERESFDNMEDINIDNNIEKEEDIIEE
ncbi:MAG: transglutaminase domain-containing protein [Bacilli bacterium]|nr:transglutaminase domain-containing protein [Bacilli bacterium]